ncbi:MAG: GAF domain-containing protein [Anaeromyxobacter sp.]|nr:GAF domain-containing protein [Anaeromyxobacter sp.]
MRGPAPTGWRPSPALWIPAVYAAVAAVYVVVSDDALGAVVRNRAEFERWSVVKGWGFVVLTALLLHLGLRRVLAARQAAASRLERLEARWRGLVESSPDGIIILEHHTMVFANQAALRLLRAPSAEALVGLSMLAVVDPADHAAVVDRTTRAETGRPYPQVLERRMRRLDGEPFRAEVGVSTFVVEGVAAVQVVIRDVTQAWAIKEELRRMNAALRMLGAVNEALVRADGEPQLMAEVCRIAVQHGGYRLAWAGAAPGGEAPLHPVAAYGEGAEVAQGLCFDRCDGAEPCGPAGLALRSGRPCVVEDLAGDARLAAWRAQVPLAGVETCIALPLAVGGERLGVLVLFAAERGAFDDPVVRLLQQLADDLAFGVVALRTRSALVEERARLGESRERLRALAGRLQTVREDEKTRMARDLHDELGQLLTGLKMDLRWLENRLGELPASEQVSALLDRAVAASELADQTVISVQRIASELRPGALDRLGLAPALRQEARRFQERTGIECRAELEEGAPEPLPEVATALYRICQEAMTNVSRHAEARVVVVSLRAEPGALVLRVEDDGRGLDEPAMGPDTLGLLGMTERATLLGGWVRFERGPERGTVVTARLPVAGGGGGST